MTRRRLLELAALGAAESACNNGRPEARLLPSRAPLPRRFETPLPIPPLLRPVRSDASGDFFEMTARSGRQRILPGFDTTVRGYEGIFPGPLIEARRDRPVSLTLHNSLDVPIVNHLHGGRTPPESDGYPTHFVKPGASREYVYPNQQRAATLWYHDHRMDHTGEQVWRGLAGLYILRDPAEERLFLPSGEREIPLAICDRSFDANGDFLYPAAMRGFMGGVLGDVVLVNGAPWPRLEVANVKYRFRVLNASNARRYELALDPGGTFAQIGSDRGLLAAPVVHRTLRIAPAERFDVVVDFSRYAVGSSVELRNGADGSVMRFDVTRRDLDTPPVPARLSDLRPPDASAASVTREFDFRYVRATGTWTVNGKPFEEARIDAAPRLGATEIWRLRTDFSHPLHLHLVHFQVLGHSGRPRPYDAGLKDTVDLSPGEAADILVQFDGYRGRYVFHCHNLEHEDMAMMANFEVV